MNSTGRCALCDGTLPPATSEQRRSYCSNACRQRAYRRRATVAAPTAVTRQNLRVLANLPAARDTFIGRQQELSKLDQLMRRHRLVTLLGSAGAGKTRLALEAAGRLRRGRTDRVLLVELGEVTSPQDVLPAVAHALGVVAQPDEPLRDTVLETLVNMKVVVVLDNCEHLLDTCAELADMLLNRCPGVRVLATSREALWITGEVSFHVEGLPVPSTDRDLVTTAAPRSEAVKLFVDRARERKPDFRLTPENTASVALLCARLEGMPLAIELAARWVQLLPVIEICDRMDEPLELLTLGCRKSPARQRSLREAIDWSYQLLAPDEQFALRRLSVFDGGFDLAAATEVCSSERSAEPVLDVLSRLQAKSLVTAIPGTTRFRQLESVRLHAREKLLAAGELDVAYEALARWFTDLADVLITSPLSVPAEVQDKIDNHVDSLLGTVEWAADRADERLLLLTSALADCAARRGRLGQARVLLRDALRRPSTRDDYRCVALSHAVDRQALIDGLHVGGLQPRATLLQAGLEGIPAPPQPEWLGQPAQERRAALAAEAGRLFGRTERPPLRLLLPAGPGGDYLFARLRYDWSPLGIQLERAPNARSADLVWIDEVAPSSTPAWFLRRFRCGLAPICLPEADELMDRARETPDARERSELFVEAAGLLDRTQAFIPIAAPIRWSLVSGQVPGFEENPFARHTLVGLRDPRFGGTP